MLFEILTPAFFMKPSVDWIESNRKVREDGKEIVQYSKSTYDEENRILSWPLKYDLVDGEKVIETEEMELLIKLYYIEELKELLAEVGFKTAKVFKDYTDEAATETDQVVVFEVSKV
ncbi:hypothetical protein H1D32_17475 [Anaerobacillus sp. CMMVII]|uniref:hypothetical protein n=1 Tax=Anaerobacillus sp. CMMVII TaxID=2755588 RepID=UPI0021B739C6|nr:hypothetical protein [Anaerobacillus sp. CMMVII]MCT8139340.1 hypothetical protein [Anaerobacillus sp. CMMVII]